MNLIEGGADFILVARSPSEDELNAAQVRGVVLDVQAVALDAFVFLVHVDNPVDDLALDTIRDIYTGRVTTWAEVTGDAQQSADDAQPIHTYRRNPNSGSQELMEKLVMQGEPMIDSPDMILETMIGPIHAIGGDLSEERGDDRLGIGYSVYYYAMFILPHERVKLIGIDGVPPTSENIASRAYPLTTEVYAVVREDTPKDSTAVMLRNWLLTADGQAAIALSGYVPIR
jgi:phosphate transport system substrate-binding protein